LKFLILELLPFREMFMHFDLVDLNHHPWAVNSRRIPFTVYGGSLVTKISAAAAVQKIRDIFLFLTMKGLFIQLNIKYRTSCCKHNFKYRNQIQTSKSLLKKKFYSLMWIECVKTTVRYAQQYVECWKFSVRDNLSSQWLPQKTPLGSLFGLVGQNLIYLHEKGATLWAECVVLEAERICCSLSSVMPASTHPPPPNSVFSHTEAIFITPILFWSISIV
jgi:hypothetical protein